MCACEANFQASIFSLLGQLHMKLINEVDLMIIDWNVTDFYLSTLYIIRLSFIKLMVDLY